MVPEQDSNLRLLAYGATVLPLNYPAMEKTAEECLRTPAVSFAIPMRKSLGLLRAFLSTLTGPASGLSHFLVVLDMSHETALASFLLATFARFLTTFSHAVSPPFDFYSALGPEVR